MSDKIMEVAKKLMKKFKPYFDEKKNELTSDAPEDAKKAFRQFTELLDDMMEDKDLFTNAPYFTSEDQAKDWAGKHKNEN